MPLNVGRGLLIAYESGAYVRNMISSVPHLTSALVTIGVGLVMCRMGFRERRLQARSSRGRCASCGRNLGTRRRCPRCG
jgi:hypothetical protein